MAAVVGMADLSARLEESAALTTETLDRLLVPVAGPRGRVIEAMRYSALSGGKRLRPFLVMETAGLFGLSASASVEAAAALEITPNAAKQWVYRLRKRYRELFRDEVARTVDDDGAIDDEIGRLLQALGEN